MRWIVEARRATRVLTASFRNYDHHALPGTSKQDAVGVEQVALPNVLAYALPTLALEPEVIPLIAVEPQVAVPDDAGPVELQALDLKFRGDILQVVRGSHVILVFEEPAHRVHLDTNIDGVGLEALRL